MFYNPIISQMLAAEHHADLERKLRHLQRSDIEIPRRGRRLGRRQLSE